MTKKKATKQKDLDIRNARKLKRNVLEDYVDPRPKG